MSHCVGKWVAMVTPAKKYIECLVLSLHVWTPHSPLAAPLLSTSEGRLKVEAVHPHQTSTDLLLFENAVCVLDIDVLKESTYLCLLSASKLTMEGTKISVNLFSTLPAKQSIRKRFALKWYIQSYNFFGFIFKALKSEGFQGLETGWKRCLLRSVYHLILHLRVCEKMWRLKLRKNEKSENNCTQRQKCMPVLQEHKDKKICSQSHNRDNRPKELKWR